MKRRVILTTTLMLMAFAAHAQLSPAVGNPPGNTLAPAATSPAPAVAATNAAPAVVVVPVPATNAQTPAQLAAEKFKSEVVCKSSVETGSLVARRKVCLTRRQWQYVNNQNEDFARKMMMDNMGHPPGN